MILVMLFHVAAAFFSLLANPPLANLSMLLGVERWVMKPVAATLPGFVHHVLGLKSYCLFQKMNSFLHCWKLVFVAAAALVLPHAYWTKSFDLQLKVVTLSLLPLATASLVTKMVREQPLLHHAY